MKAPAGVAMCLAGNCKNGISSYELHRCLGVTQKTAWFVLQRIRLAMQEGTISKMRGMCESKRNLYRCKRSLPTQRQADRRRTCRTQKDRCARYLGADNA